MAQRLKAQIKTAYSNAINSDAGIVISSPCVCLHGQITSCGPKCVRLTCSRETSSEGDDMPNGHILLFSWGFAILAEKSGETPLLPAALSVHCYCFFLSTSLWNHRNWKQRHLTELFGWSLLTLPSRTRDCCCIQTSLSLNSESDLQTLPG